MSDKITELLTRGVDKILPSKEELEKVLRSGNKLRIYQGFDPTGTVLHIGHLVGLKKLRQWQDLGHEVIFLIGDFTGMVGDPSGKTTARKMLTKEEVEKNAKEYVKQAGKILRFDGDNPVKIKYNSEWLGKLSAIEFLRIAALLSVQQVVERDLFQERQKKNQDIFMNEFLYPVMQAYDSVAMDVDVELGATDQMFNMMMGRKLMRHMLKKDKFVMITPLLTDSEGKKIGKTEGNVIGLTDKPEDLFGKLMGLSDDVIVKAFEYLTNVPIGKIEKDKNPMELKKQLALEIVKDLNSEEDAKKAQEYFEKTVQKHELPEEMPTIDVDSKTHLEASELLVVLGLATSRSEAKRLVDQGSVEVNSEVIQTPNQEIIPEDNMIIKVGKRNFVRIKLK